MSARRGEQGGTKRLTRATSSPGEVREESWLARLQQGGAEEGEREVKGPYDLRNHPGAPSSPPHSHQQRIPTLSHRIHSHLVMQKEKKRKKKAVKIFELSIIALCFIKQVHHKIHTVSNHNTRQSKCYAIFMGRTLFISQVPRKTRDRPKDSLQNNF